MMNPSMNGDRWMIQDIFGNVVVKGIIPEGNSKFLSTIKLSKECSTPLEVIKLMEPFLGKEEDHEQH